MSDKASFVLGHTLLVDGLYFTNIRDINNLC